jgi:3-methyladenine DNA glycosylase/8-oxoguanine DNA glycosylase
VSTAAVATPGSPAVPAPRGAPAPAVTAPETTAPETTAPETTAPETTAPETTAPETTAPETTAPETTAPDPATPDSLAALGSAAPDPATPDSLAALGSAAPDPATPDSLAALGSAAPAATVPGPAPLDRPAADPADPAGAIGGPAAAAPAAPRGAVLDSPGPARADAARADAARADAAGADAAGVWRAPFALDVSRTLGVHRRGRGDPAFLVAADGSIWRTALTPDGPGTIRVSAGRPEDGVGGRRTMVRAAAWGPGASWLLRTLPAALGADDDPAGFTPVHPALRQLARRHQGLRIGRTGLVMEALVPAVLEQKVTGIEAHRAWRRLLLRYGLPAPGPVPPGMRVCPPPLTWRRIPSWEWHRAGVEAVRARTIIGATHVAARLEEITAMRPADADRRLQSLPGIGPWTSAEIRQRACGDPDAVSVGDLHLPGQVGWALVGRVVDDAGMLDLLAPYAGHRHRAASLITAGRLGPPRRAPRMPIRDFRTF